MMTRANDKALVAFLTCKAEIDSIMARLQSCVTSILDLG